MEFSRVKSLVHKEFLLDWKEKNSIASILIYVTSTVFVCYLSFQTIIDTTTFNALLWIIILFTSVNTITKSFVQESENRLLYMYSLANPQEIIMGKLIYNSILLLIISLVTFSAYALFLGNPILDLPGFIGALVLGSVGLSILLTVMAAIASKSSNNPALMAILSFPIIIPFLITIIALSLNFSQGVNDAQNFRYFFAIGGIMAIGITMAYILFPYLWRD
ncbi:MAG: heme exporter protein CcmB [Salibacteraceae bacterium]|nr:heme exporter protein CcmB [Salibacteraceae bacterium]